MLTRYLRAAMARARYELLEDDGTYYGAIADLAGVWANAPSLEACKTAPRPRDALSDVAWDLERHFIKIVNPRP